MYFSDQGNQTTSTHDRAVQHAGLYKDLSTPTVMPVTPVRSAVSHVAYINSNYCHYVIGNMSTNQGLSSMCISSRTLAGSVFSCSIS